MNYKTLILIALALCMCVAAPVAAVWQNGNWIADDEAPDAQFDSVTGVSSKYVPIDNSIPTDGCGALYIQTLTHHAIIGAEFTIQRINPENLTFVNGARIQKEQTEALETVAPANTFTLNHVGAFDDRYAKGSVFLITLLDGNGGQSEYALAEMFEFQRTDVVFLGHGVSMGVATPTVDGPCRLVIVHARYGINAWTPLETPDGVNPGVIASLSLPWKHQNVEDYLRGAIANNELHISANYPAYNYNVLFGDPYVGVFKRLIVRFRYECPSGNTEIRRICLWEDEDLNITKDTLHQPCNCAGQPQPI